MIIACGNGSLSVVSYSAELDFGDLGQECVLFVHCEIAGRNSRWRSVFVCSTSGGGNSGRQVSDIILLFFVHIIIIHVFHSSQCFP